MSPEKDTKPIRTTVAKVYDPIESHETFIGMLVTWMHKPRGGYGYTLPVPAKIVKLNLMGDRAVIEVETIGGRLVRRNAHVDSLRRSVV